MEMYSWLIFDRNFSVIFCSYLQEIPPPFFFFSSMTQNLVVAVARPIIKIVPNNFDHILLNVILYGPNKMY